ncbi:MAG: hypothetical protein Hals2KO_17310 [Halioglobus sp.]
MTAAARKGPERSAETRERLLLTALHLYADKGIHAVSLRRISAEAGSKNSAAMHYHFNNQQGVLEALMRMIGRELEQLAKAERSDTAGKLSLRQAFRNHLQPLVQLRTSQPWGADAVRFLSRLVSEQDDKLASLINDVYAPFWRRMDKALAHSLPDLPHTVRKLRLLFITTNVVHGVAESNWLSHSPLGDLSSLDEDTLLDHLVDYLVGGLTASSFTTA